MLDSTHQVSGSTDINQTGIAPDETEQCFDPINLILVQLGSKLFLIAVNFS